MIDLKVFNHVHLEIIETLGQTTFGKLLHWRALLLSHTFDGREADELR